MSIRTSRKSSAALAAAVVCALLAGAAGGASAQGGQEIAYDIPAGSLSQALSDYGRESGRQIVFTDDLVRSRVSHGLKGSYSPDAALAILLDGTGLVARVRPSGAIMIERKPRTATRHELPTDGAIAVANSAGDTGAQLSVLTNLQPIVVTAEHFRENEESTAISMSVMSGRSLLSQGVTDMQTLSTVAPDVNFTISEGNPILTMRGVSSLDTNELGDPAVSVDTDGFYLILPYALDATLYDVDHIEVLRGPQGTLNGRNSVGGAINVITADPTNRPEGYASLSYGNYDDLRTEAMLNVPVTDWLQVRGSFASETHAGYRDNSPQPDADDADNQSGRLKIRVAPSADWVSILTLQYTSLGGQGQASEFIPYVYTPSGALDTNAPPNINPFRFPVSFPPARDLTDRQGRLQSAYTFGSLTLTALGGFDQMAYVYREPQPATPQTGAPLIWAPSTYPDTYNGEIRLSQQTGRLRWQVGFFAFGETMHLFSADEVPYDTNGDFENSFGFKYAVQSRSRAGYGQLTWRLTHGLSVTAGARYTHDYKEENGYYGSFPYEGLAAPSPFTVPQYGEAGWHKLTYLASIQDQLAADKMIYAKVATGYKAGGFNLGAAPYGQETETSYESGFKGRFLSNRLQLNADGYFANDTGQQVNSYVTVLGETLALTENAGTSHIYGVEADGAGIWPVVGTVRMSVNYLHARYTQFMSAADPSDPTASSNNLNLAGNAMPQSPNLTLVGSFEHTWLLGADTLSATWQTKYATRSYFSFYNTGDSEQHPYAVSDVVLTFEPGQPGLQISAYVRNLTNKVVLADAEEDEYAYSYLYAFQPPRTWGMQVEYRFGR